ncbi:MAG: PQQ-dependent sugar dehydrogenase [Sulfitobacter sp.]|nr:PQQ-dependent sugar dehydrogenase [Sulfitobacter sp.]
MRPALLFSVASLALAAGMATAQEQFETSAGPVQMEELAQLRFPWGMEYLPDDRLLITEKPGNIRIYAEGTLSEPLAGVPEVAYRNQGGLLDIAVAPDFEDSSAIYFYFVEAAEDQPETPELDADPRLGPFIDREDTTLKGGAVARAVLGEDGLSDVEVIWRQEPKTIGLGHYGGRLTFMPDGKLIVTSGERQKFAPAQDPETNLGKIIRLNADGSIPEDNPYADEGGLRAAVWSQGHRNPLGMAVEPGTGDLWIHEMGPLHGDELNRPERAGDFGWPSVSNGEHYNRVEVPHHETALDEYVRPVYYWRPAISPSGLAFYEGDLFPDWEGSALLGGLSAQTLVRLSFEDGYVSSEERIPINLRVRDVEIAPDGAILLLTDAEEGTLLRMTPVE